GLYLADGRNLEIAEGFADKDSIIRFPIDKSARIIDITRGEGERLFNAFRASHDEFATHFGADILAYPYGPIAYVVKNAAAVGAPSGHTREVESLDSLI